MSSPRIHWLDSNVYIQAKHGPYRFKVFPRFWAFLDEQFTAGTIRSPKMVYDEIVSNEEPHDDLALWLKTRRQNGVCVPSSQSVQVQFRKIADHVMANYGEAQVAEFLGGADPWLIAHALDTGGIVVTHESAVRPDAKRILIPNVCAAFGVSCINTYEMLERLNAKF